MPNARIVNTVPSGKTVNTVPSGKVSSFQRGVKSRSVKGGTPWGILMAITREKEFFGVAYFSEFRPSSRIVNT